MKAIKFYPWFSKNATTSTSTFYNNSVDPRTEIFPFLVTKKLKMFTGDDTYKYLTGSVVGNIQKIEATLEHKYDETLYMMRSRYFYCINDHTKSWCYVAISKEENSAQFDLHKVYFFGNAFLQKKTNLCYFKDFSINGNDIITLYRLDKIVDKVILSKLDTYTYTTDNSKLLGKKEPTIAQKLVENMVKTENTETDKISERNKDNTKDTKDVKDNSSLEKIQKLEAEISDLKNYKDAYLRNIKELAELKIKVNTLTSQNIKLENENNDLYEKLENCNQKANNSDIKDFINTIMEYEKRINELQRLQESKVALEMAQRKYLNIIQDLKKENGYLKSQMVTMKNLIINYLNVNTRNINHMFEKLNF